MEIKIEAMALSQFKSHLRAIRPLMDDPSVNEIMLNRPGEIWVERGGVMARLETEIEASDVNMLAAVRALAAANSRDVEPALDCRMPGYRIAAALPPVGIHGPAICIRKHARSLRPIEQYTNSFVAGRAAAAAHRHAEPAIDPADPSSYVAWLRWLVLSRKNFLIVGSTGSGKTTFLNSLLALVPETERVLTIEDTAELQIATPNYVSFESDPNAHVDIRTLVRLALRFRPDRIFVGEVRGAESYDLLDALNTGHDGGASTIHAPSPEQGLYQLENFVRMAPAAATYPLHALRRQIANTFYAVIFCSHRGDVRGPEKITRIKGVDDNGYVVETLFDATQSPIEVGRPLSCVA